MMKLSWFCLFLAFLLNTCSALGVNKSAPLHVKNQQAIKLGGSPRDFFDILSDGNEYYFAHSTWRSWHDASSFCNVLGMKLVSMDSEEKDLMIGGYVFLLEDNGNNYWWTSGVKTSDIFVWTGTGKVFTNKGWQVGEPDGDLYPDGLCVNFYGSGQILASWNDNTCAYQYHYVCEF